MDSNTFMGYLITAILALLGGAGVVVAIIIKPVINLNSNIVALRKDISALTDIVNRNEKRIEKHGNEIDEIKDSLRDFEGRVSKMEGAKHRS